LPGSSNCTRAADASGPLSQSAKSLPQSPPSSWARLRTKARNIPPILAYLSIAVFALALILRAMSMLAAKL
jgi:hypothetical protein